MDYTATDSVQLCFFYLSYLKYLILGTPTTMTEVTPTIGPKSGGTEITFRGSSLNQDNETVQVMVEGLVCAVNFR